MFLKAASRPATDSEGDTVEDPPATAVHPIEPKKLRVFPEDSDIPKDQLNTTIDEHFVPIAHVVVPNAEKFDEWKEALTAELRRVVFPSLPDRIPPARATNQGSPTVTMLETEAGISVRLEN